MVGSYPATLLFSLVAIRDRLLECLIGAGCAMGDASILIASADR